MTSRPRGTAQACESDELPLVFRVGTPLGFTFSPAQAQHAPQVPGQP